MGGSGGIKGRCLFLFLCEIGYRDQRWLGGGKRGKRAVVVAGRGFKGLGSAIEIVTCCVGLPLIVFLSHAIGIFYGPIRRQPGT